MPKISALCQYCHNQFTTKPDQIARGRGKYCSSLCFHTARRVPIADRFWQKVDQSGGPDACWPWLAACQTDGYGAIKYHGKQRAAHCVAFYLTYGTFPVYLGCHTCDNPPCCNPAHIFDGTPKDNTQDMVRKNRHLLGSRSPNTTLTEDTVRQIKQALLLERYHGKHVRVAKRFGITRNNVRAIDKGITWKHVTI